MSHCEGVLLKAPEPRVWFRNHRDMVGETEQEAAGEVKLCGRGEVIFIS